MYDVTNEESFSAVQDWCVLVSVMFSYEIFKKILLCSLYYRSCHLCAHNSIMLTEEYVLIIVEYCVVRICSVENDVCDVGAHSLLAVCHWCW